VEGSGKWREGLIWCCLQLTLCDSTTEDPDVSSLTIYAVAASTHDHAKSKYEADYIARRLPIQVLAAVDAAQLSFQHRRARSKTSPEDTAECRWTIHRLVMGQVLGTNSTSNCSSSSSRSDAGSLPW